MNNENSNKSQVQILIGSKGYTTNVTAGKHQFVADEPESLGGTDLGPNPYDFLLASLGSCTAITIRMYADRKAWTIHSIEVSLSHSKEYAKDCEGCEDNKQKIDRIDRTIKIVSDLDEQQLERLMKIADKCPVHKTLHNTIQVHTNLVEA